MKMFQFIIVCILINCLTLTGCSKNDTNIDVSQIIKSSANITSEGLEKNKNTDVFVLTIWNNSLDKDNVEKTFKKVYPKAQINVVNVSEPYSQKIIKALAMDEIPDVVIYSSGQIGSFNALDGFEDLSQPKYNIKDVKSLLSEGELEECMSFDGKKLIAFPFTVSPIVTYYRSDILEQYGIPTDPKELGDLMETPEGWLTVAEKLKKNDKFAIEWKNELVKVAVHEYGYFDKDMNLGLDNEKFKETLETMKKSSDLGLMGGYDIWTDAGKKALKDGKIAMVYLNSWGEVNLKLFAPETAGKWRATRLPLGMYCSPDTINISVSSSSKYKQQAVEVVKQLILDDRKYNASIKNLENEFLGGQKSMLLYGELGNKLTRKYPTLLDDKVDLILNDFLNNNIRSSDNVENIIDSIKSKVNDSIYPEQKILSDYVKENRKP